MNRNAYSLIELVVIITFILLFTSFSLGYYNQYAEQKKLENAGKKMTSVLDLARAKTLSGDSSLCGGAGAQVESYRLDIVSANEYVLQPQCAVGVPTPIYYTAENSIVFPTPTLSIPFFPVTGGSNCNYVVVKNNLLNGELGMCRYVKVSSTGLTSEDQCTTCATCPTSSPCP